MPGECTIKSMQATTSAHLRLMDAPSEDLLATLYQRFKDEGTLDMIFHEQRPRLSQLLEKFQAIPCVVAISRDLVVGIGWLNYEKVSNSGHYRAEGGLAFLRKRVSPAETLELGRMMVDYAFQGCRPELYLEALYATVPAPNRASRLFLRRLGFALIGPIPKYTLWNGELADSYFAAITREQWQQTQGGGP